MGDFAALSYPSDVTFGSDHPRSSAVMLNGLDEPPESLLWVGLHSLSTGNERRFH